MKKTVIYSLMAALLLAVVAIFFFYPDDVNGRVLQQHDIQQGLANGHEGQQWKEITGEQPRWTNALFSGMPTYQISPSYPANSMLGWIQQLYMLWLPSPANLLFGMMIGFFIMCLCMGIRWTGSLFGAVAWGLSTYFIIIIGAGHIWKFMALMYIPPTIGGIALIYRGRYLSGLALASLFGALQLMSNHIQMSYYFMLVILAMVIAWLCTAIRNHTTTRWGLATATMLLAGITAVGVNAPSLYNSYSYSRQTIRGNATELPAAQAGANMEVTTNPKGGLDLEYMTAWSYGKSETWSLLIPNVKGGATIRPEAGQNRMLSLAETPQAESLYESGTISPQDYQMLSQMPQYFGEQPMTNGPVYVGAFVLVLAVLAMFVVKGPMKWALFVVSLIAVMLAWGSNMMWFTEWWANNVPGYNKFRTVASILVIVEFTIPLLAVLCLVQLSKTDAIERFNRNRWLYIGVFAIAILVCFIGWLSPSLFGDTISAQEVAMLQQSGIWGNPEAAGFLSAVSKVRLGMVSADAMRSLWFIVAGTAVVMLYLTRIIKHPGVMVLLVAAVCLVDLLTVNGRYISSDSFTDEQEFGGFTPTVADKAIMADTTYYRVMDVQGFGEARSSYFHKTIGGYHAAKLTRYNDLITHQLGGSKGINPAVLNMLNAKYILSGDQYELNPQAMGNAWFVDRIDYVKGAAAEMNGLDSLDVASVAVSDEAFRSVLGNPQPRSAGDTVALTYYSPDRLSYNASTANGGVAVFSEVYFPDGWQATIDGKPAEIGRVNYVLRALRVPAGQHHIEFMFTPGAVSATNGISTASIAAVYIFCLGALVLIAVRIVRRRKDDGAVTGEKVKMTEKK